jgi:hypothetical protein
MFPQIEQQPGKQSPGHSSVFRICFSSGGR